MKELTILEPGQRLREIRKKLGLKQEDLAGENMSKNYISMFENGKRRINIINASYFADIINNKAYEKGIALNVTASYFVKNEKDLAREKCIDWMDKILDKKENNKTEVYKDLYKIIYLSNKYKLEDILAKALELKGKQLYRNGLYSCAITHFSKSLSYYTKELDDVGIENSYLAIGKTHFMDGNYRMAIAYYNLASLIENEDFILYYKALSYYKLGEYEIAKGIIDKIMFKDERVIELENYIYKNA